MKQVALLRGINVGKSVQVPMKVLKVLLEELGFSSVVTYLNSGNAVFDSPFEAAETARRVEAELATRFGQPIPTLVKTAAEILAVEAAIPAGWQNDDTQQSYVAYLFADADRPELADELPIKKQYVTLKYLPGALMWNIARNDYNLSQINKIVGHKSYSRMTTRNVNTARKLAELCRT